MDGLDKAAPRREEPSAGLSEWFLSASLRPESLFQGKLHVLDRVDSTNTRLKQLAAQGAPEGTLLLAEEQTGGRGTQDRRFHSPRGEGVYLSLLLRPQAPVSDLRTLTAWTAVAACRGIESACGAPVEIKWLNDIVLQGKKLCGILVEAPLPERGGRPDFVVIGIGVNLAQSPETFQQQGLDGLATSLAIEGYTTRRSQVALGLLQALERLYRDFPQKRTAYLEEYRRRCMTLGRRVSFLENGRVFTGTALQIENDFALSLLGGDGRPHRVSSGALRLI